MIVGTSDGGAHLDRDDGAEAHTWFLQHWVREWGGFTLEEGVRQITAIPAALCGFTDRGLLLVGYAADIMIFDPDTVGPDQKYLAHDFPNGAARWTSKPQGVHATIVNGVPDRARRRAAGRRRPPRPGAEARHEGTGLDGGARGPRRRRGARRRGRTRSSCASSTPGLCHSDVSVLDGTIPFPTPVVLGHEGAGVVEEVGDAVQQGAGRRPRRAHHPRQLRPVRRLRPRPAHPLQVDDGQAQPARSPSAARRRSSSPTPACSPSAPSWPRARPW